jgi:DNA modification methylase
VLTDPPYILDLNGGSSNNDFGNRKLVKDKHIDFISDDFDFESVANEWIRICKKVNLYICCSNAQVSRTMNFFEEKGYSVNLLIWDKPNPIPLCNGKYVSNLEFIVCVKEKGAYFNNDLPMNKKLKSFKYSAPTTRIHPTEKPIELISDLLILKSKENDIVVDCFSGSGVLAVACHNLKRRFICIEKDFDYWNASCKRLEDAQRQGSLF